jgi:hypothetical protein
MAGTRITIDVSGPLFQRDVRQTIRQNARTMLLALAEEGAGPIQAELRAHASSRPTHAYEGVKAELNAIDGQRWLVTSAIHQYHTYPWPGGGSKVYKGGKLEARIGIFRRVANAMRRSRKILAANLTKGLE